MSDMLVLIEPQIPALRRYARGLTRDRAAADDLVQDCLERAISRWHQRRQDSSTRAWLFSILHNLAMGELRRTQDARQLAIEDAEESSLARPGEQPARLEHRDLLRGLEQLSEAHRSVLLLVGVEDLSYAETAHVLEVPIGTVMSRLSRAREKLAQLMEGGAVQEDPVQGDAVRGPVRESHLRRIK